MELETKKIIDLHKIDTRLKEIEEEKGDLPEIIKEQEEGISDFNTKVGNYNDEIESLNKLKTDYNTNMSDFSLIEFVMLGRLFWDRVLTKWRMCLCLLAIF